MSQIRVNNITNRTGITGPTVAGIASVSSSSHFVVPTGRTGQRYADDGENIVRDGLVLYLDAKYSYPGASGTNPDVYTWYDMSGNENHGELKNGVGYSPVGGGSLVFDGIDDYVNLPYTLLSGADNFSVSIWLQSSSSNNGGTLFGNYPAGNLQLFYGTNYIGMWLDNSSTYLGTSPWSTTLPEFTTNFTQIVALRKNTRDTEFYINGVLVKTGISLSSIGSVNNFRIGTNTDGNERYIGKIAQVSMYKRALSAQEVLQNYNATKSRYGL